MTTDQKNELTSEQSEWAVLGSMIVRPALCDTIAFSLDEYVFTTSERSLLFSTLIDLHAAGIPIDDPISLESNLKRAKRFEAVGGQDAIDTCLSQKIDNPDSYVETIRELYQLRRIVDASERAIGRCLARGVGNEPESIAESLRATLGALDGGSHEGETKSVAELASGSIDRAERAARGDSDVVGIPTTVGPIDGMTGGVFPGLTVIAARPSMGKTALGYQILNAAARSGVPAYFVSLEMTDDQLGDRTIASDHGISSQLIRTGRLGAERISALRAYVESDLRELPFHIWRPKQAQTIEKIMAATRLHVVRTGARIVAIDHLLKIKPTNCRVDRHHQIAHIINSAKDLSTELGIAVLMLTQAKRKDGSSTDRAPTLDELYGSSMIEADADDVWLIHRPGRDSTSGVIKIAKSRNGSTSTLDVSFDPVRTEFGSPA